MRMKMRRVLLTAAVAALLPLGGGVTGPWSAGAQEAPASASELFASGMPAMEASAAARETAEYAANGWLGRLPGTRGTTVCVTDFGARGDDRVSDTEAILRAMEAAGEGGTVLFPAGTFYCAELRVPSRCSLLSMTTWGFDGSGATVLVRNTRSASCILDLTGVEDVVIGGISVDTLGKTAQTEVDAIRIVNSRRVDIAGGKLTTGYRGRAVYVENSSRVTVRGAMLANSSYGVEAVSGEELLIADCWLTSCHPAGYYGHGTVRQVRLTANRIEWCGTGVLLEGASEHTAEGNYFDRCTIGGIRAVGGGGLRLCGNINQRNGVTKGTDESCNVYLDGVTGAEYRGNVMEAIRGDGADTNVSPEYAMILRGLRNSRIVGNTAYKGYVAQLLLDYGGHRDTEIAGNPGTAYTR